MYTSFDWFEIGAVFMFFNMLAALVSILTFVKGWILIPCLLGWTFGAIYQSVLMKQHSDNIKGD